MCGKAGFILRLRRAWLGLGLGSGPGLGIGIGLGLVILRLRRAISPQSSSSSSASAKCRTVRKQLSRLLGVFVPLVRRSSVSTGAGRTHTCALLG